MKKWIILIITMMVSLPLVFGLEECQRVEEPQNIPCLLVTGWTPPNSCDTYQATIYNQTGGLISTQTMGDIGISGRCNATFNYTALGQYYINSTMGDTWNVLVDDEKMSLNLIIGIGIVSALLFWLAFKLESEHFTLKLLLILSGITMLILVPLSTFQVIGTGITFYRTFLYVFVAIWLYIIGYFIWFVISKMQKTVRQG